MSENYLVTTALKSTFPKRDKIIFLGEWCKIYNEKKILENRIYETSDYLWDDRKKFIEDYNYSINLIDKISKDFYDQLNKYHNLNNSFKYWNIIAGPWLATFIQIYYERYINLKNVLKNFKINKTIVLDIDYKKMLPRSFEEFAQYFITDTWNHLRKNQIRKLFLRL